MSSTFYRYALSLLVVLVLSAVSMFGITKAAPGDFDTRTQPKRNALPRFAERNDSDDSTKRRLREGTVISNTTGYFRQDGDGATFVTDEGLEFGGLANLNLERVARTLKGFDESKSVRWQVSGVVTEFSARNYLLISRAVYKSTAPPPVPERLSN